MQNPERASNIVYVVCGALLVLPVYALARRVYGVLPGMIAALLLALFPALAAAVLYWGTMTEPLYLLLIFSGLLALFIGLEDDRLWLFVASGACSRSPT